MALPAPDPPMPRFRFAGLLALLLPTVLAHAAPPEQQWFTVLLDGRKIGSFESTRVAEGDTVETMQAMDLVLERAGVRVTLGNSESTTETRDGKPLAFRSVSRLSGSETVIEGRVHDGRIAVDTRSGGAAAQAREMPWPRGALLAEGIRLAAMREGLRPGTRYRVLAFQPSSLDTAEIDSLVGEAESVDLPDGRRELARVTQTTQLGGLPLTTTAWVDREQTIHKLAMPILGVELTLIACDRACATAPSQGTDVFERTLMASPRALTGAELGGTMRYTLHAKGPSMRLTLPRTDEQRAVAGANQAVVTVRRDAARNAEARPGPQDTQPNEWLQSDAPEILALAKQAAGDARDSVERMRRIEAFVRRFIRKKTLGVGYASALEVARNPEGDCTEHALLVAALGRALGIPTRVVDGLAYAPGFAGKQQVFVPHAWAQAWTGDRWRSFDAALNGFDAGHIALSVGDGDPWRFYAGLDLLGRVELKRVEAGDAAR